MEAAMELGFPGILVEAMAISSKFMRMNIAGVRNPIRTEPNQALQRTNMLVTDRAPSSTLRAKHVRR